MPVPAPAMISSGPVAVQDRLALRLGEAVEDPVFGARDGQLHGARSLPRRSAARGPAPLMSARVVEDHAQGEALAAAHAAQAVAHVHAMEPAGAAGGPRARREQHEVALPRCQRLTRGLRARPLLDQQELAARVVETGSLSGIRAWSGNVTSPYTSWWRQS